MKKGPRILVYDIETSPILAHVWSIWEQNVGLNQIAKDWHIMAWAAKWVGEKEIFYRDQRNQKDITNDKGILLVLWELLDLADIVVTQNGKAFDQKKINTRFVMHGIPPPNQSKHIDTKQLAKKNFAFTSNKLEFLSGALTPDTRKSQHKRFPGFELWLECLKGNTAAWEEMRLYNQQDVLATEKLYKKLAPWGTGVDLNLFRDDAVFRCQCGSTDLNKRGFGYSAGAKYQKYQCRECGHWTTDRSPDKNLFSLEKRKSLRGPK